MDVEIPWIRFLTNSKETQTLHSIHIGVSYISYFKLIIISEELWYVIGDVGKFQVL